MRGKFMRMLKRLILVTGCTEDCRLVDNSKKYRIDACANWRLRRHQPEHVTQFV